MAHNTTGMSRVKNPSERLGQVISRVEDARDKNHKDVAIVFPILDRKVLDVNVARTFSRMASIDHFDGSGIVFIDRSRR